MEAEAKELLSVLQTDEFSTHIKSIKIANEAEFVRTGLIKLNPGLGPFNMFQTLVSTCFGTFSHRVSNIYLKQNISISDK